MYSRDCMVVIPFFKWWFGVEEAVVATALRSGLLVCSRPGLGYHCNWGWRLFFPWFPLSNFQTQRLNLFLLWILVTWSTREYLAHNKNKNHFALCLNTNCCEKVDKKKIASVTQPVAGQVRCCLPPGLLADETKSRTPPSPGGPFSPFRLDRSSLQGEKRNRVGEKGSSFSGRSQAIKH